jgi:hypothetical protein
MAGKNTLYRTVIGIGLELFKHQSNVSTTIFLNYQQRYL